MKLTAAERLERLLSIVPWVVERDGPTIEEISARFDYPADKLLADLNDVVFMVGLYPFTPDQLVEVEVTDDRVWIRYAEYFERPLRLTPTQGLALVAAGSSLLAVPGAEADGPLARGLAKLAASLGVDRSDAVEIALGPAAATAVEQLREAVRSHRQVEIDYYAFGRDEQTTRRVDPYRVFSDNGQWYVAGFCHLAGGERLFRIDRISELALLDDTFEPPTEPPAAAVFRPDPADPRVRLRLAPDARWVIEHYPCEEVVDLDDGRVEVTLAVSARPWLERLLLRLGPQAELLATSGDLPPSLGRDAARRILDRYRQEPDSR